MVFTKLDTFAIRQCKLHRATCRRFDTIPACDGRTDGQTDGIAIASTALAMRALRGAVKTNSSRVKMSVQVAKDSLQHEAQHEIYGINAFSYDQIFGFSFLAGQLTPGLLIDATDKLNQ